VKATSSWRPITSRSSPLPSVTSAPLSRTTRILIACLPSVCPLRSPLRISSSGAYTSASGTPTASVSVSASLRASSVSPSAISAPAAIKMPSPKNTSRSIR
jgi:hypothetical protein